MYMQNSEEPEELQHHGLVRGREKRGHIGRSWSTSVDVLLRTSEPRDAPFKRRPVGGITSDHKHEVISYPAADLISF